MIKKRYIVIALGMISVLLAVLFYSSVILAQPSEYDPWLDYNEDGTIDVNDLSPLGQSYGSSGDSTKNVNVTNFPRNLNVSIVRHSWNVTFAINREVGSEWESHTCDVARYRQVTVGMRCISGTSCRFIIHWLISGVLVRYQTIDVNANSGQYCTFTVQSDRILLEVRSNNGVSSYSLGLYATD